jgi:hypothetical protein
MNGNRLDATYQRQLLSTRWTRSSPLNAGRFLRETKISAATDAAGGRPDRRQKDDTTASALYEPTSFTDWSAARVGNSRRISPNKNPLNVRLSTADCAAHHRQLATEPHRVDVTSRPFT